MNTNMTVFSMIFTFFCVLVPLMEVASASQRLRNVSLPNGCDHECWKNADVQLW